MFRRNEPLGAPDRLSRVHNAGDFTVKVNTPVGREIEYKSLGVLIDEAVTWRPHISAISKKISAGLAISVKRVSPTMPLENPGLKPD